MTAAASSQCKLSHCHVPETPCDRGEHNYWTDCPNFMKSQGLEASPGAPEQITEFPWTGNTFGLDELAWLAARGRPRIFAPVGAYNTGKTTFLIALYLGLCRGVRLAEHHFAGSYTLGGWENLAHYLRYPPQGVGPGFPPHTPVAAKAAPGLLHCALRRDGRLLDVLLSDAPGEWFTNWSVNVAHTEAVGARWIAKHADGFLLFVDCDALAGSDRGVARDGLFKLGQRVAGCVQKRPVAVVWAKSDVKLSPTMREQVETRLKQLFPTAQHFATSVKQSSLDIDTTAPFLDVLAWLLSQREPVHDVSELSVKHSDDPFLAFRGRGA
jgi:hypothetical protein